MHILHVTPYYAPAYSFGGVVRAVEGLSRALVRQGHSVTVLTTDALSLDSRHASGHETLDGVRVVRVPNRVYALKRFNLSSPYGMGAQARELLAAVDVVHLHEFRTVENLLVAPLAKQQHKPVLLSPHGTINRATGRSTLKRLWDATLSPRIAQQVDHVVTLAPAERDDVQALWRNFPSDVGFSVIPNGVDPIRHLPDPAPFRQQFGIGRRRVLLFMGRLHERKGVEALLRAFLAVDLPDVALVFAGPDEGMRARLQEIAGTREDVIFTGYLEGEARLQALAAATVFALPAIGEGLSMAVLEALSAGIPVLLSPGCNLPEAQTHGAGRIVAPTPDALAPALRRLFSQDDLAAMSHHARTLIEERFTWETIATQMLALYRSL